jgi:hypothetical protein
MKVAAATVAAPPAPATSVIRATTSRQPFSTVAALSAVREINTQLWSTEQASRLSGLLNFNVFRPSSPSLHLPTDVTIEGAAVEAGGGAVLPVFHDLQNRMMPAPNAEAPLALNEVGRIGLSGSDPANDVTARTVLTLNRNGVRFPVELPAVKIAKGATGETRLVQVSAGGADVNLKKHLQDNRMYYSQAVFRSLDATQTALLLSGFGVTVNG